MGCVNSTGTDIREVEENKNKKKIITCDQNKVRIGTLLQKEKTKNQSLLSAMLPMQKKEEIEYLKNDSFCHKNRNSFVLVCILILYTFNKKKSFNFFDLMN